MSYFAIGDIAVIGLAVMGQNLILNMASHGFIVVAYNRTVDKVKHFLDNEAKNTTIIGALSVQDLVSKLKTPRKIMLLVKAGEAVDNFIEQLVPLLSKGDIIIDGGNSDYKDSQRRFQYLSAKNLLFVGVGVSGGEDGARYGPSLMPGGSNEAWPHLKDILQTISAKVDGVPCCDWVGSDGAGHFVKMVHNGIEYGDMQLICEIYSVLLKIGIPNDKIASIFEQWNSGELNSFLIEITKDILRFKSPDGQYLISKILDCAGQKGTGKWTVMASLEYGVPVTLISEAVFSRFVSALFDERQKAFTLLNRSTDGCILPKTVNDQVIDDLKSALYASKIVSYAQGFMLLKKAAEVHKWQLNYGQIALMWRGGCIIRSQFLGEIKKAFEVNPQLENLLFADYFVNEILKHEKGWRNAIKMAIDNAVPVPALTSALAFFDGYRSQKLPANLIQAQRDYFGAHTYQLIDDPFGPPVHTNWTGHGGNVSSTTYQA